MFTFIKIDVMININEEEKKRHIAEEIRKHVDGINELILMANNDRLFFNIHFHQNSMPPQISVLNVSITETIPL